MLKIRDRRFHPSNVFIAQYKAMSFQFFLSIAYQYVRHIFTGECYSLVAATETELFVRGVAGSLTIASYLITAWLFFYVAWNLGHTASWMGLPGFVILTNRRSPMCHP